VYQYNQLNGDKNKEIASAYLKKAKEISNQNIDKAVYFAKRAVSLQPIYEHYIELSSYLEKKENYEELRNLYSLLIEKNVKSWKNEYTYLFTQPSEDIIYNSLVTQINQYNNIYTEELYYLEDLNIDKNVIKERLIQDPRIKMNKSSDEFQLILLQFVPYDELAKYAMQKDVFASFLKKIPEGKFDFKITENTITDFDYASSRDYDYMITPFSAVDQYYLAEKQENPEGWYTFNYIQKYTLSPTITIVEYAIDSSEVACPKEMRHIYHRLVSYNTNTLKIIDSKVIAYQAGTELATASIANDVITQNVQKRVFKKTYLKSDFDNELIEIKNVSSIKYKINNEGKFVELGITPTS